MGSGIFKSGNPRKRAAAIVQAVTNYQDAKLLAELSEGDKVEVLSTVDGHIVAGRQGNQIATAFHPELDEDTRLHEFFLGLSR